MGIRRLKRNSYGSGLTLTRLVTSLYGSNEVLYDQGTRKRERQGLILNGGVKNDMMDCEVVKNMAVNRVVEK